MRFIVLCTRIDSSDKVMFSTILLFLFTSKYDINGSMPNCSSVSSNKGKYVTYVRHLIHKAIEYVRHLIHKGISFLICHRHVTGCNWVCWTIWAVVLLGVLNPHYSLRKVPLVHISTIVLNLIVVDHLVNFSLPFCSSWNQWNSNSKCKSFQTNLGTLTKVFTFTKNSTYPSAVSATSIVNAIAWISQGNASLSTENSNPIVCLFFCADKGWIFLKTKIEQFFTRPAQLIWDKTIIVVCVSLESLC